MKQILTLLALMPMLAMAQKPDTTKKYHLDESTVLQISQLLNYGSTIAAGSDKISAHEYNAFVAAVSKVDSVLRVQYLKYHPVTAAPKK